MRDRRRDRKADRSPADPPVLDDTFDPHVDPSILFRLLDPELPLALLPVRLEARFLPDHDPTELVVRIFCDELHVDTHDATLTSSEVALAQVYWTTVWTAAGDEAGVAQAQTWLTDQLGAHRAASWPRRPNRPRTRPRDPASPPSSPPSPVGRSSGQASGGCCPPAGPRSSTSATTSTGRSGPSTRSERTSRPHPRWSTCLPTPTRATSLPPRDWTG